MVFAQLVDTSCFLDIELLINFYFRFFFASSKQYAHKSIHRCNSGDGQYICQLFLSTYLKAESFLAANESLSFVTRLNADRNKV